MDLFIVQDYIDALRNKKEVRYAGILIVCGFGVASAFGLYSYFVKKKAQEAQKALAHIIADYKKIAREKPEQRNWDTIIKASAEDHERSGQTALGPFFLAYKAEALLQAGKPNEALTALKAMMQQLKPSSPLYYQYATKLALLKIDNKQEQIHQEGLKELDTLAHEIKNKNRDWAAYYVGYYALQAGDKKTAEREWSSLAQQTATSPWAVLAAKRLPTLIA